MTNFPNISAAIAKLAEFPENFPVNFDNFQNFNGPHQSSLGPKLTSQSSFDLSRIESQNFSNFMHVSAEPSYCHDDFEITYDVTLERQRENKNGHNQPKFSTINSAVSTISSNHTSSGAGSQESSFHSGNEPVSLQSLKPVSTHTCTKNSSHIQRSHSQNLPSKSSNFQNFKLPSQNLNSNSDEIETDFSTIESRLLSSDGNLSMQDQSGFKILDSLNHSNKNNNMTSNNLGRNLKNLIRNRCILENSTSDSESVYQNSTPRYSLMKQNIQHRQIKGDF